LVRDKPKLKLTQNRDSPARGKEIDALIGAQKNKEPGGLNIPERRVRVPLYLERGPRGGRKRKKLATLASPFYRVPGQLQKEPKFRPWRNKKNPRRRRTGHKVHTRREAPHKGSSSTVGKTELIDKLTRK